MIQIPPYLKQGDVLGLVCPAGYMPLDNAQTCMDTLRQWGYGLKIGKTMGGDSPDYFSGTDAQRLADFQDMLDDPGVKAILCGRGGYGLGRIIDQIDFEGFKKNPKWIIGYSDVTVLHAHIHAHCKVATLHAPMASAFNGEGYQHAFVQSLRHALAGVPAAYHCPAHGLNRPGEAHGTLVGGNLSLLAHLCGTASDLDCQGKILFLEDVGEYLYHIDRMMVQLKRSGKLDLLAGLVIGSFSDMKDTQRPFGKTVYELIYDQVKSFKYPVCFQFPVGHTPENYALKVGVPFHLKVGVNGVTLAEDR